jgi:hypothetical protein
MKPGPPRWKAGDNRPSYDTALGSDMNRLEICQVLSDMKHANG